MRGAGVCILLESVTDNELTRGPAIMSAKERYVHHFESMKQGNVLGGALSTGMGAAFTGERVYVGIVTKKKGTGSKAHYHLDETFNYVLKGALKVVMDGEEFIVPTGALLHIPPKVVHTAVASDEGDAVYLVCRDTTSDGSGQPTTVEV